MVIGRSERAVFQYVLDQVWKNLQGWREKVLSRVGREVLIKAIIQAAPMCALQCFRFQIPFVRTLRGFVGTYGGVRTGIKGVWLW